MPERKRAAPVRRKQPGKPRARVSDPVSEISMRLARLESEASDEISLI